MHIHTQLVRVIDQNSMNTDVFNSHLLTLYHWQISRYPEAYRVNLDIMAEVVNSQNAYYTLLQGKRDYQLGLWDLIFSPVNLLIEFLLILQKIVGVK